MAIGCAIQRGDMVFIYDEKGNQLSATSAGDGLYGFTQSVVSIRRGSSIYMYDERASQIGMQSI